MPVKAFNSADARNRATAAVSFPRPGDFPIGSPASRAAARLMLNARTRLSAYDKDCYTLYKCTSYLHAGADPDYSWMQTTPAYKRGSEIRDALEGPITPAYLDPEHSRRTIASLTFELTYRRKPLSGEVLYYSDVEKFLGPEKARLEVERIQGAWARRICDRTCPFLYKEGRMFIRQKEGTWEPNINDAIGMWRTIEDDALGRDSSWWFHDKTASPYRRTLQAVKFDYHEGGKRRAVALTHSGDFTAQPALPKAAGP